MSAKSDLARHKSALRSAMARDKTLSRAALALGIAVLERIYAAGGYCGAPIATLQTEIGVRSQRSVHAAIDQLAASGYVQLERSAGGPRRSNRIFIGAVTPQPAAGLDERNPAADCRVSSAEPRSPAHLTPQPAAPLLKIKQV